jgi:hypothetical protein
VRTVWAPTQVQPPATATRAMPIAQGMIPANHANTPPEMASIAAGNANGRTRQTPQASAPVAAMAAEAAAFVTLSLHAQRASTVGDPRQEAPIVRLVTPALVTGQQLQFLLTGVAGTQVREDIRNVPIVAAPAASGSILQGLRVSH